jgi:hypothetical protein
VLESRLLFMSWDIYRTANFGTLAASNALGEVDDIEGENGSESPPGPWYVYLLLYSIPT